ncbi:MAG: alpha-glucan family phosphorylase, partial [Methanobacteriota archaeon]
MADRSTASFPYVPERISGLVELAYNLWWSWHPEARVLFKQIDQQAWKSSIHNPVRMLRECPPEFMERVARDPEYLRRYDIIMARFHRDMQQKNGWFSAQYPGRRMLSIAYFSAEYGLHHSLPFYAGGLGFLAGDHVKECSDLGLPLVAVGFLYSEGYVHQHIRTDGWQETLFEGFDRDTAPITRVPGADGGQLIVRVPYIEPPISVAVWKVDVGRVPLYLLDTDIPENDPANRTISSRLYIGDAEQRLRQEIVLGIGGRKVLNILGVEYYAMHLNEGHPAFALLERVRERVERGMTYEKAFEQVRGTTVFTTHTPVPAAHDIFPHWLMDKYFSQYYPSIGLDRSRFLALGEHPRCPGGGFSMDAFAMRASKYHNGVSQRHGEVARSMWQCLWPDRPCDLLPIDAITNGVHLPTWLNPRMEMLYNDYLTAVFPHWQQEHDNPAIWELVDEIPDAELWRVHRWLKTKMINRIREQKRRKWEEHHDEPAQLVSGGLFLNPSVLTIGFARRFSSYKRADLVFHDL